MAPMNSAKLVYKPLGTLLGAGAGMLVAAAFSRLWRSAAHSDHVPQANDEQDQWGALLLAAALQGAAFAAVKAAVDRATAQGVRRVSGRWPA